MNRVDSYQNSIFKLIIQENDKFCGFAILNQLS